MIRFKQYIRENYTLIEANASHFQHISGFDPQNPEHKKLVDAFNKSGFPTNHASKVKTLDDLKTKVAPGLAKIHQSEKSDKETQDAIHNGDAELVHNDPEKGVKVYKVHNQRGSCAVGKGTKWCVASEPDSYAFHSYDPSGKNSHIIHLDKEKGNLSRIGIIGVKSGHLHKTGEGGNFQDKGNLPVSDEDWNRLRKKYDLDKIKSLSGIRGIPDTKTPEEYRTEIDTELKSNNPAVRMDALKSKYVTPEHISKALRDPDSDVRKEALKHPTAVKPEHITQALNDPDSDVRKEALKHPTAVKPEHITQALKDHDKWVSETAILHPTAVKPEHITQALKDSHPIVKEAALKHPTAVTSEHITQALDDNSPYWIKLKALEHPTAVKPEHIDKVLNDKTYEVRYVAQQRKDEMAKNNPYIN